MNSEHKVNARPTGGVAFLARRDLKVDCCLISNRVATLTLQVGPAKIGLLGCYAPTEPSEDIKAKEAFYRRVKKAYRTLSVQCKHLVILEDFNC